MNLLEINKNIIFEPIAHTYHDTSGKKFTSVSSLLSQYKMPFDEFGHIARACAKRDGMTVDEIKNKWRNKSVAYKEHCGVKRAETEINEKNSPKITKRRMQKLQKLMQKLPI